LKLLNKYLSELLVFAVTFVAAFFFFVAKDLNHSIQQDVLQRENADLMIQNLTLQHRDAQKNVILTKQQMEINALKRNLDALLNGNYTQNEDNKQREHKVVGESEVRNLGL
tara:strand:+ start:590 stop:922 length:333 start_codon:yes stop_codon:yes gene_type:complete